MIERQIWPLAHFFDFVEVKSAKLEVAIVDILQGNPLCVNLAQTFVKFLLLGQIT